MLSLAGLKTNSISTTFHAMIKDYLFIQQYIKTLLSYNFHSIFCIPLYICPHRYVTCSLLNFNLSVLLILFQIYCLTVFISVEYISCLGNKVADLFANILHESSVWSVV